MNNSVRVLYLLRQDEPHPHSHLLRAAGSVHLLRAGELADEAAQEYKPQLVCIHAPFDRDARIAVEKIADLALPTLGIGIGGSPEGLSAQVSEAIPIEDLRTILELLASGHTIRNVSGVTCHAENSGQCLGRMNDDVVRLLEHLLSLRFADYHERAERIFDACLWIGSHLCLPSDDMKDLLRAARLREIGKLGLPDRIVFARREERSVEDQAAYDRYPQLGAHVIREVPSLRNAAKIVECQLENFDGSGPAGLMAHQIPLGSRVLRVAATFASIIATGDDRERTAQEALIALEKGRGSLFDPLLVKLVDNFHRLRTESSDPTPRRWVRVADLAEGMVLAEDVWSRTGMKILPSGTRMTDHVLKLMRQFPLDPSLESVQILK